MVERGCVCVHSTYGEIMEIDVVFAPALTLRSLDFFFFFPFSMHRWKINGASVNALVPTGSHQSIIIKKKKREKEIIKEHVTITINNPRTSSCLGPIGLEPLH